MDLPQVSLNGAPCQGSGHLPVPSRPQITAPAPPSERAAPPPQPPADTPAAPGHEDVPAVVLVGGHLAPGERAWLTLRHWAQTWWRQAVKTATNPRGPYHAQPESLAQHDAYRRSRAWIPDGHEGKLLGPAGDAYHHSLAVFGLVTGYAWAWVWARPLRLAIAAALIGGIVLGFWLG